MSDLTAISSLPFNTKTNMTLDQVKNVYDYSLRIIEDLDEEGINELLSGNEQDLDKIIIGLTNEIDSVLHTNGSKVKASSFGYLDKLTNSVEDTLRKLSFNYFITSTLPDFEMDWHHLEWGNLVQMYKYLGIIAARDHSKSYTFSKAYPLWKMYRYEGDTQLKRAAKEYKLSKEGILITNEFGLGKHLLGIIKEEIENNEVINSKLHPGRSEGWGKESIKCKNGASLLVKSYGSKMRGFHPGYIIVDDFLNESNLYNKEQRDKYKDFMHSVIMNMIVPGGQVVVVGTPFHEDDLYADLKKKSPWKVFEYPALFPNGEVLWDKRHNLSNLLEKRSSQGSLVFSREILVRPVSNESSIFPWPLLERAFIGMDKYCLLNNMHGSDTKKFKKVVIGCDFAISSSIGADYSVFTTIGVDDLDNYWLLNVWRKKGASYNEQLAALKKLNSDFLPSIIMAESNSMQKIFTQMMKDSNLPVIEHTTGQNKYNLENGVPALGVLFEQDRMRMPRGDQHSRDLTDVVCNELASMTFTDKGKLEGVGQHDDCAMSLWIAIRAAKYVHSDFNFSFI